MKTGWGRLDTVFWVKFWLNTNLEDSVNNMLLDSLQYTDWQWLGYIRDGQIAATAFSVACGNIQEKYSNLKFL